LNETRMNRNSAISSFGLCLRDIEVPDTTLLPDLVGLAFTNLVQPHATVCGDQRNPRQGAVVGMLIGERSWLIPKQRCDLLCRVGQLLRFSSLTHAPMLLAPRIVALEVTALVCPLPNL